MRTVLAAIALVLLVAACSKVTPENFAKIQDGMAEQEVLVILGSPTESSSATVLGISGTTSRWVSGDAEIMIRFLGGKVAVKSFDKPAARK